MDIKTEEEQLDKMMALVKSQIEEEVYIPHGKKFVPMAKFYLN